MQTMYAYHHVSKRNQLLYFTFSTILIYTYLVARCRSHPHRSFIIIDAANAILLYD